MEVTVARTVKQVAKASLGARATGRRARAATSAWTGTGPEDGADASGQETSASPIYEELVAELGDPSA